MPSKGKAVSGKKIVEKQTRGSQSARAGLVFPVGRVRRLLKKSNYAKRIGVGAAGEPSLVSVPISQYNRPIVYLAAVLEYLMAELLELAGNCARDNHRVRIIPRHLLLAVRNDYEYDSHLPSELTLNSSLRLDKLLAETIIAQGGVRPHIHACLVTNKANMEKGAAESSASP
ncbi:histone-fold-containing protein [Mycena sp. CBHHK59/15]|nr:histone-fold-containing protein [Mycena sp. CBHHK59/15]